MAPRRRTIVLATASVLLAFGALCVGGVAWLTQTDYGRAIIRRALVPTISAAIPGRLYVGRVSGTLFTDITIDSLDIREPSGAPFISTGPITVTYDPRDLLDRRIILKSLDVQRPQVTLTDYSDDDWSWKRAMRRNGPRLPERPGSFGQFVAIDTATLHDGQLTLRMPWDPADSLKGTRRDSALTYNLKRQDGEIRRDGDRTMRVYRFVRGDLALGRSRLADPDSAGQRFDVRRFDVVWVYPPFWFRNFNATVRKLDDSLWVDHAKFNLANSSGSGSAKVVWGGGKPVRYDVKVRGDTVAMTDIAWIDQSLPHSGSGSTSLTIRNDPKDLTVMEYALRDMDAKSLRSHLRGKMTFGVGGPVLRITDVALDLQPANTDLLRQFNGRNFPYDWQGELSGRVSARGGPVNKWMLDEAALSYADAHVPGAVSRATITGMLDILKPADAVFHDVLLTVSQLDLRTPRFVNKEFPTLEGIMRGSMRLDSTWYNARFSQADLDHVDGIGQPSHFTGAGRYALLKEGVYFDVDMQGAPVAYTTVSRSYPSLPLRGSAVGSIRATGFADDFSLLTTLAGEGGEIAFSGRANALDPNVGAAGSFRLRGVNLQTLFGDARYPVTTLSMVGDLDLHGSDRAVLHGPLRATIDQYSRVADVRVFSGTTRLVFDSGHVKVDTLAIESSALRLAARGGVGLLAGRRDTLSMTLSVDSLGGLRPWLQSSDPSAPSFIVADDTLRGTLEMRGRLVGSIDSLDAIGLALDGRVDAAGMIVGASRARRANLTLDVQDVLRAFTGGVQLSLDSARLAGIDVASAAGRSTLRGGLADGFGFELRTPSESRVAIHGGVTRQGDTSTVRIDTLSIRVDSGFAKPRGFALATPALFHLLPGSTGTLDSLVLVHSDTGRIALRGSLRDSGAVSGRLDIDRVPLADLGQLLRSNRITGGSATADFALTGTRDHPQLSGNLALHEAVAGRLRFGDLLINARYDSTRLGVEATLMVDGRSALKADASLPLDLALVSGRVRRGTEPLTGRIVSGQADLSLIEALFPDVTRARGRFSTDVQLAGTWEKPTLRGQLLMDSAALTLDNLGIRLEQARADIGLAGDTVYVRRFGANSGTALDTLGVSGMVSFSDPANPVYDLRLAANNFLAIDKPRLASLTLTTTTPLSLIGPSSAPRVRGAVRIDRGRVYISALAQRRGLDLSENLDVIDTARVGMDALLPEAPNSIVRNLVLDDVRVNVGDDVWLRSPEANLKMGGSLRVTRSASRDAGIPRLTLADSLTVDRGTYQLNLGIARPGFQVERGVVRFFGDPDLEPALDITALHTVRELRPNSNRQDVRIRVAIGGTLDHPTLKLSSADNPPLPESDMLSYLVTGEPAYALLENSYAEQGATLALRLAGSYLSSRLAGGRFDVVQVEPTALTPGDATNLRDNGLGILASTRVGLGGQIARNTFVNFSTGLCGLAPQTSGGGDALSLFAQGLGAKIERRFDGGLSLSVGLEPGSSAQACGRLGLSRTFQQTPPQIGIDFFRSWTF